MAIYLVVACFAILHFPRRMGACGFKLAVAAAAYKVAASFGVEEDATATVALLLAVPALFRLYQFAITLLATFPLQLTFPFVVDLIPRFSITAENFFTADGATPEVAARRKKEGEVRRVKEKITTINARVRQLASQKRAPLPAEMQSAVKTLGSVEITAQQSGLLTKQMAESGAQQGWLPS